MRLGWRGFPLPPPRSEFRSSGASGAQAQSASGERTQRAWGGLWVVV